MNAKATLKTIGTRRIGLREVHLVTASRVGYCDSWPVSGQPFCLVIVMDKEAMPHNLEAFFQFVVSAIDSGCRLFLSVGDAAGYVENLIDEQVVEEKIKSTSSLKETDVVLTVALRDQKLSAVTEAALDIYHCAEQYNADECPVVFFLLENDHRLASFHVFVRGH